MNVAYAARRRAYLDHRGVQRRHHDIRKPGSVRRDDQGRCREDLELLQDGTFSMKFDDVVRREAMF